jgi:hypothetical protein
MFRKAQHLDLGVLLGTTKDAHQRATNRYIRVCNKKDLAEFAH